MSWPSFPQTHTRGSSDLLTPLPLPTPLLHQLPELSSASLSGGQQFTPESLILSSHLPPLLHHNSTPSAPSSPTAKSHRQPKPFPSLPCSFLTMNLRAFSCTTASEGSIALSDAPLAVAAVPPPAPGLGFGLGLGLPPLPLPQCKATACAQSDKKPRLSHSSGEWEM